MLTMAARVKDFRKNEDEDDEYDTSELPEIDPTLNRLRRAEYAARDSFERDGFENLSFRTGVVPKGRPRRERGGAPIFKVLLYPKKTLSGPI